MEHYELVTTTGTEQEASTLAVAIVEARLGACVHLMPITAVYRWGGTLTRDAAWRLVVKTAGDRLAELMAYVREHHPDEVPQVTATRLAAGSPDYLTWVTEQTRVRPQ